MRENLIRIGYIIISIGLISLAISFYDDIIGNPAKFNQFSYIGTVATLVGLIVTIFEVIHNAYISKSIQKEASLLLNKVQLIENASSISDCLAAIDDVSHSLNNEDYKEALKSFLFFRRICVKAIPDFDENIKDNSNPLNTLGNIEFVLRKATHTNINARLSKPQKTDLMKNILQIKQEIEQRNPARR